MAAMPARMFVQLHEGNVFERMRGSAEYIRADLVQGLVDALQFYADAETYLATTLFCDRPCGAIAEDFGPVPSLHADQETIMQLGARARTALKAFGVVAQQEDG